MSTKLKQAKMNWTADEYGTNWGYPATAKPGLTVSYFTDHLPSGFETIRVDPLTSENVSLGIFGTNLKAKAACAVDALKYL